MKSKNNKILLLAVLLLCSALAAAQTKKFRWTTELCEFEGTYDAKKYTEAQLRNTQELLASLGTVPLFTETTAWKYNDIKKLSIEELDREYKQKSEKLKNLDIVKSEYWETIRQNKLKETEQVYKLSRITIQAYTNPAILKQYTPAEACVKKYADPLINGGDDLLKVWREVNEESRKRNGNPERVRMIFERKYNSPDKLKYALLEVMSFGWWNCANDTIEYVVADEKPHEEFNKLFKKVKTIYCDEP